MSKHQVGAELPDTYGLPEYLVSNIATEIDGPNVRIVCGVRRGGQTHWLFSVVTRADQLIQIARECEGVAEEAFNLNELMRRH